MSYNICCNVCILAVVPSMYQQSTPMKPRKRHNAEQSRSSNKTCKVYCAFVWVNTKVYTKHHIQNLKTWHSTFFTFSTASIGCHCWTPIETIINRQKVECHIFLDMVFVINFICYQVFLMKWCDRECHFGIQAWNERSQQKMFHANAMSTEFPTQHTHSKSL